MRVLPLVFFGCAAAAAVLTAPARAVEPAPAPRPRFDLYGDPLPPGATARLGTLRFRSDSLRAFALSPDGKTFVTNAPGSSDERGRIHLWDAATGAFVRGFDGRQGAEELRFSRDGKRLAGLGAPAHGVLLFDVPTGKFLRRLDDRTLYADRVVYAFDLHPDGTEAAELRYVPSGDGNRLGFRRTQFEAGATVSLPGKEFTAASGDYEVYQNRTVAYSRSGDLLVTWGAKGQPVRVFDLKANRHRRSFDGHAGRIEACAFSPDERYLACAGERDPVRVWDLTTGKEVARLKHPGSVFDLAFTPDGKALVTGAIRVVNDNPMQPVQSEGVRCWDLATGKERWMFSGLGKRVAVSPDGKRVFAAGESAVHVLDAATGKPLHPPGHEMAPLALAFSPDGRELVSAGGWGGHVCVWDTDTRKLLREYRGEPASATLEIRRTPAGQLRALDAHFAARGQINGAVRDLDTGKTLQRFAITRPDRIDRVAALSPDGSRLAVLPFGKAGEVREVATGKVVCRIEREDEYVLGLTYSPDGRTLAVCSRGEPVRLLDAATGKELRSLGAKATRGTSFHAAVFSPDGAVVAELGCVQIDGRRDERLIEIESYVRLWDVASGKELRRWKSPVGGSYTLSVFSPDGRWLAATAHSHEVHIWDTRTGKEVRRIEGPERVGVSPSAVTALAFSPDGKAIATAHWDATVLLWDVSDLSRH